MALEIFPKQDLSFTLEKSDHLEIGHEGPSESRFINNKGFESALEPCSNAGQKPSATTSNSTFALTPMTPVRISLVTLGSLKQPVDVRFLSHWRSEILTIRHGDSVAHLEDSEGDEWSYTDKQLERLLAPAAESEITLGLINAPLEDNFYLRRLPENVVVLSLYEMAEIVQYENFSLETFILRIGYELAVLFKAEGRIPATGESTWTHDDIRGCLFDMCSSKGDIVFSLHRPCLCDTCRARVLQKRVDARLLPQLHRELRRIHKTLFYRLTDWIKIHPVLTLALTTLLAFAVNLASSAIFEKAKRAWPWMG